MSLHNLVVRGREPDVPFRAIRTIEVELSEPLPDLVAQTDPQGTEYVLYRVLVRLHHHPLGLIVVDVSEGPVGTTALETRIYADLGPAITAHLRDDMLLDVSELISSPPIEGACRSSELRINPAPLATVIVCTFGRPRQLRSALHALLALSYENFEVIVVDNDPSDPVTIDLFESEFAASSNVRYIAEPKRGLSNARNSGIAAARGDIIAFTDDDIVVDKEWLSALVCGFDEAGDIVCVTGLTLASELDSPAQQIFEQYGAFNKGYETLLFERDVNLANTLLYPYTAGVFGGGGNCAVRRKSVEGKLEFDRRLGPGTLAYGAEDLDLFVKFILSGKKIRYVPVAIAWHEHRRSYGDLRWQMFTYGAGSTGLLTKWMLTDRRVTLLLVRLVPKILSLLRHQMSEASDKTVPSDLRRLERFGYIYGPIAYLRSAFADRWDRSAGRESASSTAQHEDLLPLTSNGQLLIVSPHLDDAVFSCSGVIKSARNPFVHTVFVGDAPAELDHLGPGVGRQRPPGAQILDGDVDGARQAALGFAHAELADSGHLQKSTQNPAMDRRQHHVSHQVRRERQDGGQLVAGELGPHAEKADIRYALEHSGEAVASRIAHAAATTVGVRAKVAWTVATGSASSPSKALARTKAIEWVT